MRATDLRIGNYVRYLNKLAKVRQIRSNKILLKSIGIPQIVYVDYIEPIELTEEILLNCGFEKKEFDYFILKYGNNECYFSYKRNNLELCRNMQTTASSKIKYLHQLQNLYFALTNQELTINL